MKFIATLALLVTLSFSAFAAEGQIGSTRADGQIGSTRCPAGQTCVYTDGQIGSTKCTPEVPCVVTDGQIGSTRGVSNSESEFSVKNLLDGFSLGIRAFLNSF